MKVDEALHARILELLPKHENLSEFSLNVGLCYNTLHNFTYRKKGKLSLKTVYKICDYLGCSLSEFFNTEYFNSMNVKKS